MRDAIWGTLAQYEGRWVAMNKQGQVVAQAETLSGARLAAGEAARRLTFLYAAPQAAVRS